MGAATPNAFQIMGVSVMRIESPADAAETIESAATLAFDGDQQVAVLISQRMLGKKEWVK